MKNVFLPTNVQLVDGENTNVAQLIVEPLYHGYGMTIGNAMRRILLSSLSGGAVSAVKIKGVDHEFQSVKGVMEDALEIVLNLKQLRFAVHSDEPIKLTLKKKGVGVVTAADLEKNSDAQIVNPDQKICEISDKGGEFEMEITVQSGIGFDPKESRDKREKEVGLIEVDSIFSPLRNVGYQVEDTRVGQITNYDKLTVTVETDGSLSPKEALKKSLGILIDHLNLIKDHQVLN